MEMNKKTLKKLRILTILILWGITIYGCYVGYDLYKHFRDSPQEQYYVKVGEELPEEAVVKIGLFNRLTAVLNYGLIFVIVYFFIDYKYDPERHFITKLKLMVDKIKNRTGVEVDKDEDEEMGDDGMGRKKV